MEHGSAHDTALDRLTHRKIYSVESERSDPDVSLPSVHLTPSSFVEFAADRTTPILIWEGGGFGIIDGEVFYWTRVESISELSELVELYKLSGKYMDSIDPKKITGIRKILKSLELSGLDSLIKQSKLIDYALTHKLISISIDGSEIDTWEELHDEIFSYGSIDEVEVSTAISLKDIQKCMNSGLDTYDECVLKSKYHLELSDFDILTKIPVLFESFKDYEIFRTPEKKDDRIVIGQNGYSDPLYLADLFPIMDHYLNTIRNFKELIRSGKVSTYGEYLLLKKKQYTVSDLKDMIEEGLVRVKENGNFTKIVALKNTDDDVLLKSEEGTEFKLTELLSAGPPELTMPLAGNYRNYKKSSAKYYVEWKMLRNVRNDEQRVPKDLDELKKVIALGLVKYQNKTVKDLKIEGREVYLVLEDDTVIDMYPVVSSRNEFRIEEPIPRILDWIRRYTAEGFSDTETLRLVLAIKKLELSKKNRIKVSELSKETGISAGLLGALLTSDRFKRFGELQKQTFYLHADVEEFKKSVKVIRDKAPEYIVIDGRNVMYGGEEKDNKKGRVENIIAVWEYLKRREIPEDRIRIIVKNADFNKHRVDNLELLRELEEKGIIQPVSYGYDDMEILRIALEELNALIITNDKYREFIGGNIKQEDIDSRRIEYTFRGKQFHIRRPFLEKLDSLRERLKAEKE